VLIDYLSTAADTTQDDAAMNLLLSGGPVTTASDATLADIATALNSAAKGPSAEAEQGLAPTPQIVTILPPSGYNEASATQYYGHLVDMSALASLYTAIYNADARTKRGHPEPYSITIARLPSLSPTRQILHTTL
jgi:hypothetical protein